MSELNQETPLSDPDAAVTYELRSDLDLRTFGGTLALANGTSFDLAVALQDGDGQIVTDDENLITCLDTHAAVVRQGTLTPATAKEIIAGAGDLTLEQAEQELVAENSRPDGPRKTVVEALTGRIEEVSAANNPEASA